MTREITVSAVQLWSTLDHAPWQNRTHALEWLEKAAAGHPDLVVLPEAISMLCYPDGRPGFTFDDVAESIPGPTTARVSEIARTYSVNIVVGFIEKGVPCQNCALVFDRNGACVGRYDKTHEPVICRREQNAATGKRLPVFELDFGTIGIFICWDLEAPEVPAILAAKGADLLCFPHLIGLPTRKNTRVRLRARAIDSGLPIIVAGMRDPHNHNGFQDGMPPTCLIDRDGELVAGFFENGPGVLTQTLSLERDSPKIQRLSKHLENKRLDLYTAEYNALMAARKD